MKRSRTAVQKWIFQLDEEVKLKTTKQLAQCSILISLALVLSYMERFFPLQMFIPVPGVKLGLANIVTLTALYTLGLRSTLFIVIIRCILGAVFGGGVTGLLFSMTGGLLAVLVMAAASKASCFSIYGVSILGAAAHNVGQICAAVLLMQSVYIGAYLPWLLLVALATGFATGSMGAGVLRVLGKRL